MYFKITAAFFFCCSCGRRDSHSILFDISLACQNKRSSNSSREGLHILFISFNSNLFKPYLFCQFYLVSLPSEEYLFKTLVTHTVFSSLHNWTIMAFHDTL